MPSLPAERHPRTSGDRCPGAMRLHTADDGELARIRVPGGLLDVPQAEALADACLELSDGAIHLTSRGNVELRGLPIGAGPDLSDRLYAVGLLPSVAHDRARNVVASPLSGLDDAGQLAGPADMQQWVRELDTLLCADPRLAQLSGRFLFGFDDGRGDTLSLLPDIAMVAVSPSSAEVVLGGSPTGTKVPVAKAASAAIATAHTFLDGRATSSPDAWRISDLSTFERMSLEADVRERLTSMAVGDDCEVSAVQTTETTQSSPTSNSRVRQPGHVGDAGEGDVGEESRRDESLAPRLGCVIADDGSAALSVGVQLGRMSLTAWNTLVYTAIRGDRTLRLTPWRGVILPGFTATNAPAALANLSDHGLLTDSDSPWFGATACVGRPGCAGALEDVHDHASRALVTEEMARDAQAEDRWVDDSASTAPPGTPLLPVHWSGCERRCGHPVAAHIDVVATGSGYHVGKAGARPRNATNDDMAQAVSAARRST